MLHGAGKDLMRYRKRNARQTAWHMVSAQLTDGPKVLEVPDPIQCPMLKFPAFEMLSPNKPLVYTNNTIPNAMLSLPTSVCLN